MRIKHKKKEWNIHHVSYNGENLTRCFVNTPCHEIHPFFPCVLIFRSNVIWFYCSTPSKTWTKWLQSTIWRLLVFKGRAQTYVVSRHPLSTNRGFSTAAPLFTLNKILVKVTQIIGPSWSKKVSFQCNSGDQYPNGTQLVTRPITTNFPFLNCDFCNPS